MILCNIVGKDVYFKDMDFEVLPRVSMKVIVSRNVVLYSLVDRYQVQSSSV
jgi:hypothetical protein